MAEDRECVTESDNLQDSRRIVSRGSESSSDKSKATRFHSVFRNISPEMDLTLEGMPSKALSEQNIVESSSSEFQFVNISKPADMKDSKNRKLVRRSVTFSHRRKLKADTATLNSSEIWNEPSLMFRS
jgi:hypothetical protein